MYETLSSFFAGLGSGKIRFFHDQLKYAVNDFIGPQGIKYINGKLAKFYYGKILSQLIEIQDDKVDKCSYYHDALNQIVYHCCNYVKLSSDDCTEIDLQNVDSFLKGNDQVSLKHLFNNVHFTRERILANQQQLFTADYELAIETCNNLSEKCQIDTKDVIPVKIIENMFKNVVKQWCTA